MNKIVQQLLFLSKGKNSGYTQEKVSELGFEDYTGIQQTGKNEYSNGGKNFLSQSKQYVSSASYRAAYTEG